MEVETSSPSFMQRLKNTSFPQTSSNKTFMRSGVSGSSVTTATLSPTANKLRSEGDCGMPCGLDISATSDVSVYCDKCGRIIDNEKDVLSKQWSEDHLRVLSRWKSQAFVHMYLQEKSNYYFRMIYNSLTFPVILLSSISSATLFTSEDYSIKIFVCVVSVLCACLAALQRQVRPAEYAAHHGNTAHRYQTLIHRIESCMNMVPNMRPDVRKFIEKIRTDFEFLLGSQNEPPRYVISNFEKRYGRVEGILYGDEIADMIAQSLRAQAIYKRMEKQSNAGGVSAANFKSSLDLPVFDSAHQRGNQDNSVVDPPSIYMSPPAVQQHTRCPPFPHSHSLSHSLSQEMVFGKNSCNADVGAKSGGATSEPGDILGTLSTAQRVQPQKSLSQDASLENYSANVLMSYFQKRNALMSLPTFKRPEPSVKHTGAQDQDRKTRNDTPRPSLTLDVSSLHNKRLDVIPEVKNATTENMDATENTKKKPNVKIVVPP